VFSFLTSGVFLDIERFAQHFLYTTFFTSLTYEIFLYHIFILNNWLPFQLVPLNPQDAQKKRSRFFEVMSILGKQESLKRMECTFVA